MITNIEDYYLKGCGRCERFDTPECSTKRWAQGLQVLRSICLDAQLIETAKWGHPCRMHSDRNIVVMGALRNDFRISFFNAALMKDPQGVLERAGPNTRYPDIIRFTTNEQVKAMEPIILSYLKEAIGYAVAGLKPPRDINEMELPVELTEALEMDPELAQAFAKLTPGRQKSYVLNLNSAKHSSTRISRIAKFRARIMAGKGALERL